MTRRARRHHVLPQFYLKGFANESGLIHRVDLPGREPIVLSISDASVIKDFYTVTLSDGSESDIFETAFSAVEGAAAEHSEPLWQAAGISQANFAIPWQHG